MPQQSYTLLRFVIWVQLSEISSQNRLVKSHHTIHAQEAQ